MSPQHAWGQRRLIFVLSTLISSDRVPCCLFAIIRRVFFLFLLFWFVWQSRCIPGHFPRPLQACPCRAFCFPFANSPNRVCCWLLAIPFQIIFFLLFLGIFAVLVLYSATLLAFCESALATLSSPRALLNAISSAHASWNTSSPRRIIRRPVIFLCYSPPLFHRSPSFPSEWWAFSFLHSLSLAFTFYITTNFPCRKHLLGNLPWPEEWLNLSWIFAPLAECLQRAFLNPSKGAFRDIG